MPTLLVKRLMEFLRWRKMVEDIISGLLSFVKNKNAQTIGQKPERNT